MRCEVSSIRELNLEALVPLVEDYLEVIRLLRTIRDAGDLERDEAKVSAALGKVR